MVETRQENTAQSAAEEKANAINQEQAYHQLEQRFLQLKNDHSKQEVDLVSAQKRLKDSLSECTEMRNELEKSAEDKAAIQEQIHKLKKDLLETKNDADSAKQQSLRHLEELDSLRAKLQSQAARLVEAQKNENEALKKASKLESQAAPLDFELKTLQEEKRIVQKHADWLESVVNEKTARIQELSKTHSTKSQKYEESIAQLQQKVDELRSKGSVQQEQNTMLRKNLEVERDRVRDIESRLVSTEETYQKELSSQEKLARLYKQSAEDSKSHSRELEDRIRSLRKEMESVESTHRADSDKLKVQTEELFKEQTKASEAKIAELETELQATKKKLEEVSSKSLFSKPNMGSMLALAEVSSTSVEAQLSSQGVTLKDLYDRVVDTEALLRKETQEKDKLELYMGQIVKEVQEKAPIIMGQRMDYQRALASHDALSERLDAAMEELRDAKQVAEESESRLFKAQTEKDQLAKQVQDLARQVQALLQTQAQIQHDDKRTLTQSLALPFSSSRATSPNSAASIVPFSASDVITENLVVFKDIEELQVRNQQLLKVVRELSTEKEQRGGELGIVERTSGREDQAMVSKALEELENMRAERDRQQEMIAAIVNQRDMYRVLLAQADRKHVEGGYGHGTGTGEGMGGSTGHSVPMLENASHCSSPAQKSAGSSGLNNSSNSDLRELEMEFEDYKREKRASDKIFEETIEKLRSAVSEAKLEAAKADVDMRYSREQYMSMERTCRSLETDLHRVRGRNSDLESSVAQLEKSLATAETHLEKAESERRQEQAAKLTAEAQIGMLRANESRMEASNEKLRVENERLMKAFEGIQRIESGLEARSSEEKERLVKDVERFTSEVRSLRAKNDSQEARVNSLQQQLKLENAQWAQKTETLASELADAKDKLTTLRANLTSSEEKNAVLSKQLALVQDQIRKGIGSASAEHTANLEMALSKTKQELQAALAAQEELKKNVEEYKSIAGANETALKELSSASEKWKAEAGKNQLGVEKELKQKRMEVERLQKNLKESVLDGNRVREEMEKQQNTLRLERDDFRMKLELVETVSRKHGEMEKLLREQLASEEQKTKEAVANYERELQLHAADVAANSVAKKALEAKLGAFRSAEQEISELKSALNNAQKTAENEKNKLRAAEKEAENRVGSLETQNALLHSQLEALTEQFSTKSLSTESSDSARGDDGQESKCVQELRSVIAFLRREKEVADCKLDVAKQEAYRLESQVKQLESTVDRLRADLKMQMDAKHAEEGEMARAEADAKRKELVQQVQAFQESNAHLRTVASTKSSQLSSLENEMDKLREEIKALKKTKSLFDGEKQVLKEEIAALNESSTKWKQRVSQLVEKYHQVDPEEHQKLTQQLEDAEKRVAEMDRERKSEKEELERKLAEASKREAEHRTAMENLKTQYERMKGFTKTWKQKAEMLKDQAEKAKSVGSAEERNQNQRVKEMEMKLKLFEKKTKDLEGAKKQLEDQVAAAAASTSSKTEWQAKLDAEVAKSAKLREFNSKMMAGYKQLQKDHADLKASSSTTTTNTPTPVSSMSTSTSTPTPTSTTTLETTPASSTKSSSPLPSPVPSPVPSPTSTSNPTNNVNRAQSPALGSTAMEVSTKAVKSTTTLPVQQSDQSDATSSVKTAISGSVLGKRVMSDKDKSGPGGNAPASGKALKTSEGTTAGAATTSSCAGTSTTTSVVSLPAVPTASTVTKPAETTSKPSIVTTPVRTPVQTPETTESKPDSKAESKAEPKTEVKPAPKTSVMVGLTAEEKLRLSALRSMKQVKPAAAKLAAAKPPLSNTSTGLFTPKTTTPLPPSTTAPAVSATAAKHGGTKLNPEAPSFATTSSPTKLPPAQAKSSFTTFGKVATTSASAVPKFGSTQPSVSSPFGGGFGSAKFGGSTSATSSALGAKPFGSGSTAQLTFGSSPKSSTVFGTPAKAPAFGSQARKEGIFGATATSPFGTPSFKPSSTSTLFGKPASAVKPPVSTGTNEATKDEHSTASDESKSKAGEDDADKASGNE